MRAKGLLAAVEIVADKTTKQLHAPELGLSQRLYEGLLARGLYTRVLADCICLAPPLMIPDELIDRAVDIIRETIPAVLSEVRKA
jgi:adenosylmethionine-8-amino-7-oxononanoate aminotransferase